MSRGIQTFVWFGSLAAVPPRAVVEKCQQLKVSARAELRSGGQRGVIDIVGGAVVAVSGADPKLIASWTDGSFRVTQGLPDFDGNLQTEREAKGSLQSRKLADLLAWAEEHRLTVKLDLYHEPERAHIEIGGGRVVEVIVDGKPDLAALGRLEAWAQGEWRIGLSPLFIEETAPVFITDDGLTPTPMVVPMSGPISVDDPPWLALKPLQEPMVRPIDTWDADKTEQDTPMIPDFLSEPHLVVPADAPAEPSFERSGPAVEAPPHTPTPTPAPLPPVPAAPAAPAAPARPSLARALPPGLEPTVPVLSDQPRLPIRIPRGRQLAVLVGVVAGVGLIAIITSLGVRVFKRTPPPPQPIAQAKPDAGLAAQLPPKPKRKPERDRPQPSSAEKRERARRMIERARRDIIDGKKKSAIALLEEAQRLDPDNVGVRVYLAQAKGKLGEGKLWIESTPSKVKTLVDGAAVGETPLRLRAIPAGMHTVQVGDKTEDVEVVRGKKKTVRLNLRGRVARRDR